MNVEITRDQAESLLDFIEREFIDTIRNDEGCDNMEYVANVCDVWRACKKVLDEKEGGADV